MSSQTERALQRVRNGLQVAAAARAEGVDASTLFRAIKRMKERHDGAPGRFVIVGAGGFGREVRQWMEIDHRPEKIVFLDDVASGPHIIGTIDSYERQDGDEVLIAIGDPARKAAAAERFSRLGGFVAGNATVGACTLGEGTLILPGVVVSTNVTMGRACAVNLNSTIGHDASFGDYCQLSPHVDICGFVKVGARCFFGGGATVIPHVQIGDDCVIGAGAVVIKDVPSGATVVGNPARRIK